MANNELLPYKIDHLTATDGIDFVTCKNAAFVHIHSLDEHISKEMKHPAKLNGFFVMFCASGEVTLSVHMSEITLTDNTLLVAPTSVLTFKNCKNIKTIWF